MPLLRGLNEAEVETLMHKLQNSGRKLGDEFTDDLLNDYVNKTVE